MEEFKLILDEPIFRISDILGGFGTYLEEAKVFVLDGLEHPLLAQVTDPERLFMAKLNK